MKKVYAINGSSRTNWNTATLLDFVPDGVKKSPGLYRKIHTIIGY